MTRRWKTIAALYGAIAVVTFGHVAQSTWPYAVAQYEECREHKGAEGYCGDSRAHASVAGLLGALVWPLYWSWEAWS